MKPRSSEHKRAVRKAYTLKYYELNKERIKKRTREKHAENHEVRREQRLWLLFRLTPEEWDAMSLHQGGVCAITGRPPGKNRLSVDHDHKTGLVRGLLNNNVNKALADFQDNPAWLRAAADYLENPPAVKALGKPKYGLVGRAIRKKKMIYGPIAESGGKE